MIYIILSIIIFLILITITIVILTQKKNTLSGTCSSDSDCPSGKICIFSKDYNQNICADKGKQSCSLESDSLLTCKLDSNTCDSCINEPPFNCIEVSKDKPYIWKQGDKTINIPFSHTGSGWCLPAISDSSKICNKFTSDTILIKKDDKNYEWGCSCKTNLFDHKNGESDSDCVLELACNHNVGDSSAGSIYVLNPENKVCSSNKDCNNGDVCWNQNNISSLGATGYCYTDWLDNNIKDKTNPTDGFCKCETGYISRKIKITDNNYDMQCIKDQCIGGKTDINDKNKCICDTGYINCNIIQDDKKYPEIMAKCAQQEYCIPDPCLPGIYNTKDRVCDYCPSGTISKPGNDPSTIIGTSCINPCANNGPCSAGSTCKFDDSKKVSCSCVCPFTGPNCDIFKGYCKDQSCQNDNECYSGKCNGYVCN